MGERREGRSVTSGPEGVRITSASADEGESIDDSAGDGVAFQRDFGVREGEHGGSAMGVRNLVEKERNQETARIRN